MPQLDLLGLCAIAGCAGQGLEGAMRLWGDGTHRGDEVFHRAVECAGRIGEPIDQTDGKRMPGIEHLGCRQQAKCRAPAHQVEQVDATAPGRRYRQPALNKPDTCMGCSDAKVATHAEFSAATQGVAIESGYIWERYAASLPHESPPQIP